jgi:hypothetical protein
MLPNLFSQNCVSRPPEIERRRGGGGFNSSFRRAVSMEVRYPQVAIIANILSTQSRVRTAPSPEGRLYYYGPSISFSPPEPAMRHDRCNRPRKEMIDGRRRAHRTEPSIVAHLRVRAMAISMGGWWWCIILLARGPYARSLSPPPSSLPRVPPHPLLLAASSTTSVSNDASGRVVAYGLRYTHLEGNGQIWQVVSIDDENFDASGRKSSSAFSSSSMSSTSRSDVLASFVVDPLASQLDFGIPWGYRANKRALSEMETINAICDASPSHCLLTMGLDDHTHLPTLSRLVRRLPDMHFVVAPSCREKLLNGMMGGGGGGGNGIDPDRVTTLDHGASCSVVVVASSSDGTGGIDVSIAATRGALVGPPWQARENGYLMEVFSTGGAADDDEGYDDVARNAPRRGIRRRRLLGVYYEPHGDVVLDDIASMTADVVISPVIEQSLPAQIPSPGRFTLVHGGGRTLDIAEALHAAVVLPLGNGELDVDGPLSGLVAASGTVEDFEALVDGRNGRRASIDDRRMEVARAMPGVPITIVI